VNASGYWVFFALVLLVNSLTVLIAGIALVLPAMRDGASSDEKRIGRHLVDRGGVSEDSKDAVLLALRQDAISAHSQIMLGRAILLAGAIFLVLAFGSVTLSIARALPQGSMFTSDNIPVANSQVTAMRVMRFTADEIVDAVLQDAPKLYNIQLGNLENNTGNILFSHFVFAFRIAMLLVVVLLLTAFLRRGQAPPKPKKAAEIVAEAKAQH
jgi:hypothetical protein